MHDALTALEYLPTGGRTPLAHALDLAQSYVTPATILILMTDGRANVALAGGEPWQEALEMATKLVTRALVVDTEQSVERLGRPRTLAEALGAEYVSLDSPELNADAIFPIQHIPTK
jgi:magnesium chelatase subunit D